MFKKSPLGVPCCPILFKKKSRGVPWEHWKKFWRCAHVWKMKVSFVSPQEKPKNAKDWAFLEGFGVKQKIRSLEKLLSQLGLLWGAVER